MRGTTGFPDRAKECKLMRTSAHIVISGMVQRGGRRYFIQYHAPQLGVTRWLRNLPGGEAGIEAEGNRAGIGTWLVHARRGPRSAVVSTAEVTWKEPRDEFERFQITH